MRDKPGKGLVLILEFHLKQASVQGQGQGQNQKLSTALLIWNELFKKDPTWPNSKEREVAYYIGTILHAIGVHGFTGGGGLLMMSLAWYAGL